LLLLVAAIALARGDERDANQAAEYAYYALVVSVVLLLIATALEEKSESRSRASGRKPVAPEAGAKTEKGR